MRTLLLDLHDNLSNLACLPAIHKAVICSMTNRTESSIAKEEVPRTGTSSLATDLRPLRRLLHVFISVFVAVFAPGYVHFFVNGCKWRRD